MSEGQQLGIDLANNFILMTLFSIIADMGKDPDGFRTDVKNALFDLTDNYSLPRIASDVARDARDSAKLVIGGILQNLKPSIPNG
jgi:hypothetical protein